MTSQNTRATRRKPCKQREKLADYVKFESSVFGTWYVPKNLLQPLTPEDAVYVVDAKGPVLVGR